MLALDLLGAGEGLATQTIMVRIRKIDPDKLKETISSSTPCSKCGNVPPAPLWAAALGPAIALADHFPKGALDTALPIVRAQLTGIGITADVSATDAPPPPRPVAETPKVLAVGAALGVVLAIAARWGYHRFTRKG